MHLTLTRTRRFPDTPDAVFGKLLVDDQEFGVYCENADDLIPVGTYQLTAHDSPKHPNTLAFVNEELGVFGRIEVYKRIIND